MMSTRQASTLGTPNTGMAAGFDLDELAAPEFERNTSLTTAHTIATDSTWLIIGLRAYEAGAAVSSTFEVRSRQLIFRRCIKTVRRCIKTAVMSSKTAPATAAGEFDDVQVWWLCHLDRGTRSLR